MSAERLAECIADTLVREESGSDTQRWVVRLAGEVGWGEARRLVLTRVRTGSA